MSTEREVSTVLAWYNLRPLHEMAELDNLPNRRCRIETSARTIETIVSRADMDETQGDFALTFRDQKVVPQLIFTVEDNAQWCTSPVGHKIIVAEGILVTIFAPPPK